MPRPIEESRPGGDNVEQLTLVDIEDRLNRIYNDLAKAQRDLATCRDQEVAVKHAYEGRRRRFLVGPNTPEVGKGPEKVTVAERTAWIDLQCEQEEQAYDLAVVRRETAADHLRTLRDQAMLLGSLSKAVQISMGLVGVAE